MRWVEENSRPKVAAKPPSSSVNGRPKNDGRGIEAMPFGPPVRLCQFSSTSRMISPNASVTIARIVPPRSRSTGKPSITPQKRAARQPGERHEQIQNDNPYVVESSA